MSKEHQYFTYIITNKNKTTLYTGVTNDLYTRLQYHLEQSGKKKSFAGRYNCIYLIYWERHHDINHAISREKQIKGWSRKRKENLVEEFNPTWAFLNDQI